MESHHPDGRWVNDVGTTAATLNLPRKYSLATATPAKAAVQALIGISGLIRALPYRTKSRASDYINRTYLHEARAGLARHA